MTIHPGYNGGGRPPGVRNRLSKAFLTDLLEEWREHGREAIKLMRIERPGDFVKVVASTLPKELLLGDVMDDVADDRLDEMITVVNRMIESRKELPMLEAKVAETIEAKVEKRANELEQREPRRTQGDARKIASREAEAHQRRPPQGWRA
jgi:hypothetical protein